MSIFRWRDAFSFGLAALAFTVLAIMTPKLGHSEKISDSAAQWSSWAVAGVAWCMYGGLLFLRWRAKNKISFSTRHGLLVSAEKFPVTPAEVEIETDRFLALWAGASPGTDAAKLVRGVNIVFKTMPFEQHGRPGKFAGLFYPRTKTAFVGYVPMLSNSAMAHELGHCVFGQATGDWGNEDYHAFAYSKDLP